jgi:hypothetical protein
MFSAARAAPTSLENEKSASHRFRASAANALNRLGWNRLAAAGCQINPMFGSPMADFGCDICRL